MADLNRVLLIGRLTRDPESRSLPSGSTVVSFGMAVNRRYRDRQSGELREEVCFVDVEAWGRTGETIARYMRKGRQLFVEGRLKFDTWEREGQRRSKLSVVAENFQFIGSREDGDGGRSRGEGGGDRAESGERPARAPVGARETPQDDYGEADDIPF